MSILAWVIIGIVVVVGIIIAISKVNTKKQLTVKSPEITSSDVQAIKIIREIAEIYKNV